MSTGEERRRNEERQERNDVTRREWLTRTGQAAAGLGLVGLGAGLLPQPVRGAAYGRAAHTYGVETQDPQPATAAPARVSANDKVVIALIGCGGQGTSDLRDMLKLPGVQVAAICDPDETHMARTAGIVSKQFKQTPEQIKDFRKVLERKDIDAVIVGTPDHWHALPTIYACQAGKDVLCEKPISHNITEGRVMVDTAHKYNRVVQINTWQRSIKHFINAIDYVRSGKLGKINVVRTWKVQDPKAAVQGHLKPTDPPKGLDYDLWVGPAAYLPYQENRCHYRFRWYFNYAAGMTGDWGVHMMDIALLGMSKDTNLVMPKRVASYGGKYFTGPDDDRTTPDTQIAIYEFPDFVMQWEVHVGGQGLDSGGDHGIVFIGTKGRLMVDRSGWSILDEKGEPVEKPVDPNKYENHYANFVACMKSRQQPRSHIDSMFQTTTVCHLANLAYLHGGGLDWDANKEVFTNDKSAMDLLPYRREYRAPWSLPKV